MYADKFYAINECAFLKYSNSQKVQKAYWLNLSVWERERMR